MPAHAATFDALPERLERDVVRRAVDRAMAAGDILSAFLPAMAWGFGRVGYGPHRVQQMLAHHPERVGLNLKEAAGIAAQGRALDAYRGLAGERRVDGLGPAFGTKFLYFVSPRSGSALILDRIMATCLARVASMRLNPARWHPPTYATYLSTMNAWSAELGLHPDELEQVLFTAEASRSGSQWGTD